MNTRHGHTDDTRYGHKPYTRVITHTGGTGHGHTRVGTPVWTHVRLHVELRRSPPLREVRHDRELAELRPHAELHATVAREVPLPRLRDARELPEEHPHLRLHRLVQRPERLEEPRHPCVYGRVRQEERLPRTLPSPVQGEPDLWGGSQSRSWGTPGVSFDVRTSQYPFEP